MQISKHLHWWFPCFTCQGCGAEINSRDNAYWCDACAANLPLADLSPTHYAPFKYADPIRQMIMRMKHGHNLLVVRALAPYLAAVYLHLIKKPDYTPIIIPVPLHKKRLRMRGYNQSAVLAQEVASYLDLPVVTDALIRVKHTNMQKHMTAAERAANIQGAFAVANATKITGQDILLLDDVYTSGATTAECTKVLKAHGAKSVTILTIASAGA